MALDERGNRAAANVTEGFMRAWEGLAAEGALPAVGAGMEAVITAAVKTAWSTWDDLGMIAPEPLPPRAEDPQFRYCIWCGVDCEQDEPEHTAECPSTTGVQTVTAEDLRCPGCRTTITGMRCGGECGTQFQEGDHFTYAQDPDTDLHVIICLGCAAQRAIAGG